MITSPDWRHDPDLVTDWRRVPAATSWPRKAAVTLWPHEPAATLWPREAKATAWRRDLPPEPTGIAIVKSGNTFHVGCGALTSPFVLFPLVFALFATMAAIGAYRRRRVARIELRESTLHAEGVSEEDKGWSPTA